MTYFVQTTLTDFASPNIVASLADDARRALAQSICEMARAKWVNLAQARANRTGVDYVAGIQEVQMRDDTAVVTLTGTLPNALENGQDAYDMHDTLLGPNVPTVKRGEGRGKHARKSGGYYRAIPFRHQAPGTTGTLSQPMGAAYGGKYGAALGKAVYAHAKRLAPTTGGPWRITQTSPAGHTTSKFQSGQSRIAYGGRLPAGLAPKLRPHHATDIYAGMIKQQKTYKSATQSTYTTFRTISTGSPGWRRKATQGWGLLHEVEEFVRREAPHLVSSYLSQATQGGAP